MVNRKRLFTAKMAITALIAGATLLVWGGAALALQANLSWTNPTLAPTDPVPTNILVQTAATVTGPFTTLHTLPVTATTDVDTAVVLGTQKCYQLLWMYALGNSTPLGPVCGTPAVGPHGSNLTIIFQP